MKILDYGDIITFHCESCGCCFVEARKKVNNYGFYHAISCPECGNEVYEDIREGSVADDIKAVD